MAESTTATVEAQPAPPAGLDAIDTAIAQMEQSLFPAAGTTSEQAPDSAAPSTTQETAAPPEQPAASTAQEPGGTEENEDESLDTSAPSQPTSRMGRLRQQLTQAETKQRELQQQLQQRDQQHQDALRTFIDLVLPDVTFEALRQKAEGGDWEAKQQLDQARTWRRLVGPIKDVADHAARQEFDAALADLRTLDGMDGDSHQKLIQAATPGDKVKLAWELGKKAAESSSKEQIAALQAEVQALKTTRAANGSQPANGGTPGQTAVGLAGLIDPKTGLLTDEAERLPWEEVHRRFGLAS